MKLTKYIRDAIVKSVLASTHFPEQKQSIKQRTCDLARELIAARVPPLFNVMLEFYGKEEDWFARSISANLQGKYSPLDPLNTLDGQYNAWCVEFEPVMRPLYFNDSFSREEQTQHFGALRLEAEQLVEKIQRTERELRGFLASVTTTEKLLERMPELAPHLPSTAVSYPVVASTVNLVSYLRTAGFDTNVKKVA